ncbi:MAG: hypothetical protein E5V75_34250 [Mesorhizobium sp.]|nr:MAG: hypothetical protein E5V75_34250 [Mesorhizobium sp.]
MLIRELEPRSEIAQGSQTYIACGMLWPKPGNPAWQIRWPSHPEKRDNAILGKSDIVKKEGGG